jgi:hypothetical protein
MYVAYDMIHMEIVRPLTSVGWSTFAPLSRSSRTFCTRPLMMAEWRGVTAYWCVNHKTYSTEGVIRSVRWTGVGA